jgi:hypothetical protein
MSNFRLQTDAALYVTLNVQALNELAPGGVFASIARQDTVSPWVIFQMVSKIDEHSFAGRFANALYIVKAVSESPWPKQAEDVDTQIDTLLEDAGLSISGYNLLLCRRESDFTLMEDRGGKVFTHIGGYYRIVADQT